MIFKLYTLEGDVITDLQVSYSYELKGNVRADWASTT